jgi:hypothetical protein
MKTIWKYQLSGGGGVIRMPKGAEILTVQLQGLTPCLWALVNPDAVEAHKEERLFEIYGTGHTILEPAERVYIGTFQFHVEGLVFHVFERKDKVR